MKPKDIFSKEFLDAVDESLVRSASGLPTILIYRRNGKLDIRVKVDLTPPAVGTEPIIYEEEVV
jgi:hypothetical protein